MEPLWFLNGSFVNGRNKYSLSDVYNAAPSPQNKIRANWRR